MSSEVSLKSDNNISLKHRWLTPKAKVQESPIHGLGVITVEPISKGELVCVFGGVVVHSSEIIEHRKNIGHLGFQIDDDFFLTPLKRDEIKETGSFNHSCEPNIGFVDVNKLVAIKDIEVGEELVFDYAFNETNFELFECNCDSTNCRKIITPCDWKIQEIQKKYGEYFSPYLKRKFTEST